MIQIHPELLKEIDRVLEDYQFTDNNTVNQRKDKDSNKKFGKWIGRKNADTIDKPNK